MTPDAIVDSILSGFDGSAIVMTLLAGVGLGLVFTSLPRDPHATPQLGLAVFLFAALGVLFFAARGFALYFDGSILWPRNIAFCGLWLIYVGALFGVIKVRIR